MRLRPALLAASSFVVVALVTAAPEPATIAAGLGAPTARRREAAARELLTLGPLAAPALSIAAASPDPEVRSRARSILALVHDDAGVRVRAAVVAVSDAMREPGALESGGVADARIAALAPESIRALAAAARRVASRGYVAQPLACALARHAGADSVAALAEFVRDGRVFSSSALVAARELDRVLERRDARAAEVRASAAPAIAALDVAGRSTDATVRRAVVALRGALAGDDGIAPIVEAASDVDAGVRVEAARVLGLYAPAESASTLRALAADPIAAVRETALTALFEVPGAPSPEAAVASAADDSPAVRAAAARLLGRDATPSSIGVLEELAVDPSPRVRASARRALAALRR